MFTKFFCEQSRYRSRNLICRQEYEERIQSGREQRHRAGRGKDTGVQLRVVSEADNLGDVPKARTHPRVRDTGCEGHTVAVHVLEQ